MFETSFVRPRAAAAPRRAGMFAVSLTIHTLAIAGFIATSISSVSFPKQPPDEYAVVFTPAQVAIPPAIGRPDAPRRDPAPPVQQPAQAMPRDAAPAEIPDTTASVDSAAVSGVDDATGDASGTGDAVGQPFGEPGGIGTGEGTGGIPLDSGVPLQPGGEVTRAQVLERVRPEYPPLALRNRISGSVTIRCIIGRDGRIRDPEVIASTFAGFHQAAIDAVRKWRFAPGTLRGRPVDTWFELTVRFELVSS